MSKSKLQKDIQIELSKNKLQELKSKITELEDVLSTLIVFFFISLYTLFIIQFPPSAISIVSLMALWALIGFITLVYHDLYEGKIKKIEKNIKKLRK